MAVKIAGDWDYNVILEKGALYVVATPIGNLGDLSHRAIEVLHGVTVIAAEDTRHTRRLLQQYEISTDCLALHEHNESKVTASYSCVCSRAIVLHWCQMPVHRY